MKGAEHWSRADALLKVLELEVIDQGRASESFNMAWVHAACAIAQVHATLALAAAAADPSHPTSAVLWRKVGAI